MTLVTRYPQSRVEFVVVLPNQEIHLPYSENRLQAPRTGWCTLINSGMFPATARYAFSKVLDSLIKKAGLLLDGGSSDQPLHLNLAERIPHSDSSRRSKMCFDHVVLL